MASINWTGTKSGKWNVGSNWSGDKVPGASDDVTIDTSAAIVVTVGGRYTVHSLTTGASDTLNLTGANFTINGNASLAGEVEQIAGGTLTFAGDASSMSGGLQQQAGLIDIASGTLSIGASGENSTFGGMINGAALNLASGTDTLALGGDINVALLELTGANLELAQIFGQTLTETGAVDLSAGTLTLGTQTMVLSGLSSLLGGTLTGGSSASGTVTLSGTSELGAVSLGGDLALVNTGTLIQDGSLSIPSASNTISLTNDGKWYLEGGVTLLDTVSTSRATVFTNSGKLVVQAGASTAVLVGEVTSTGSISIESGVLQFGGQLGADAPLSGTVSGTGMLQLDGGVSLESGLALSVASVDVQAIVDMATNLSYSGLFEMTGTYGVSLGSHTLTLDGTNLLDGGGINGGAVVFGGSTQVGAAVGIGYGAQATNKGTFMQGAEFQLGYSASDNASFANMSKSLYQLEAGQAVVGYGTFTNAGTLAVTSIGEGGIDVPFVNTGTVILGQGDQLLLDTSTASLSGTITGAGTLDLAIGADLGQFSFARNLSLTVSDLILSGSGTFTAAASIFYKGVFSQFGATLTLGRTTFTLSTACYLYGGAVSGAGTLAIVGGIASGYALENFAALQNTGTLTLTGTFSDGLNADDNTLLDNSTASSVILLTDDASIYASGNASLANAGLIDLTGGDASASQIQANLTSTGTIEVSDGTLSLSGAGGALANDDIAGAVIGTGTLALEGTSITFESGLDLAVGALVLAGAGTLTIDDSLTYAGDYAQSAGTLSLGNVTITLGGPVNLDGGVLTGSGTVAVDGGNISNYYAIEGSSTLDNTAGTLAISGTLQDGYSTTDSASVINQQGATLLLENNASISSGGTDDLINAGLIMQAGSTGISADFTNTSTGTLDISFSSYSFGSLTLSGADTLAGTITGSAFSDLSLNSGTDEFAETLVLTIGTLTVNAATIDLSAAFSYAGELALIGGTLALNGYTFTLSGPLDLGGHVQGAGTLSVTGNSVVTGGALTGGAVLQNSGTLVETGTWLLSTTTNDSGTFVNAAGATFRLEDGSAIVSPGTGILTNAGTLLVTGGGDAEIYAALTNTGLLTILGDELSLAGNATLGGTIAGAGALLLTSGNDVISADTELTLASLEVDGANVSLAGSQTYANAFELSSGTLNLDVSNFTLNGNVALSGGNISTEGSRQTLTLAGWTTLSGQVDVAGPGWIIIANTGTLTDTSARLFNSDGTEHFVNRGVFNLGAANLTFQPAVSGLYNYGSLVKSLGGQGIGVIDGYVQNWGSIAVTQGTLSIEGQVQNESGAHAFTVGSGAELLFAAAVSGGGTVTMDPHSLLSLTNLGFSLEIAGFTRGDVIDLNNMSYEGTSTSCSFNTANGQLTVSNGTESITLYLPGSSTSASFNLFNDAGQIGITHT